MTTPLWCLAVALFLPILLSFYGAALRIRTFGSDFDNKAPRQQIASLEGLPARVYAAQQNAWESAAVFTGAVLVAHVAGADPGASATAALVFLAARVAHAALYVANLDVLRSLSFVVATLCCLRLFQLAAVA